MHKRLNAAGLLAGGECAKHAFLAYNKKKNPMKKMNNKMNERKEEKQQQQQVNLQLEAPLGRCILRPCNVPAGRKHRY